MNKFTVRFQVKYIVIFLSLIVVVGIVLFVLLYRYGIPFTITDVMGYAAGSVAIMTLIYHALSLEYQHKFHKENLFLTRNQYAYDVVTKFNEPQMTEALQFLNEIDQDKETYFPDKKVQNFLDHIKQHKEDRQKIVMVINYFEHLSILVKNKHIDEKIVKENFKTVFISTFVLMKPYIDYCQQESSTIWCNYENMAKNWNK